MLVRFSAKNFLSIREEQTLSMVASNQYEDHPENVIELDVPGMKRVNLLKSAVIYGANASGKTNVLSAMSFVSWFVVGSATRLNQGDDTTVEPFLLDNQSRNEPSSFEMTFVIDGIRYDYGFSVTREKVYREWLTIYPKSKRRRIFERTFVNDHYEYLYSTKVKRKKTIEESTRENGLFLSVGAQQNDSDLTPVYRWFLGHLIGISRAPEWATPSKIHVGREEYYSLISEHLKIADLGIVGLEVKEIDPDDIAFPDEMPTEVKDYIKRQMPSKPVLETYFQHRNSDTNEIVRFNQSQESDGTNRYYHLLGPWLQILQDGWCGFIDEIDSSLHPHLVRRLVAMFHDKKWNQNNAQLIFTTHDTTLLSADIFRRDQVWFTEKKYEGNTVLYSLSEFKPRIDEALHKGYLAGRYGAIPFLGSEIESDG